MGSEAEKIFTSFNLSEDKKKSYEAVLKKFDEYFIPRRNIIHERACFYQRGQQPGETAEQYIRVLYEVAEHCEFGDKRDEHIRDRLVVGIQDKELSRKFQLKADLTLQEVTEQIRQAEEINKHVSLQSSAPEAMAVNMVRRQSGPHTDRQGRYRPRQDASSRQGTYKMEGCGKCGGLLDTEPVKIVLQEGAQPYAVHTARRIPLPLVPLVKKELHRMESEGIIEKRLAKALAVIKAAGLKLNERKCKFRRDQIRFLGHVLDKNGVRPDPDKVAGIENFPQPQNNTELKRFLEQSYGDENSHQDVAAHIDVVISQVPATSQRISEIRESTANDPQLQTVRSFIKSGWPEYIDKDNLKPGWPDMDKIQQADASAKQKQAHFYNRRHGVRCLPPLSPGDPVLTKLDGQKQWTRPAVIQGTSSTPRSYIVETAQGERYRRNRRHLLAVPHRATPENVDPVANSQTVDSEMTNKEPAVITLETVTSGSGMTRSGRVSRPAAKLDL
uniref:Retrotransposon gag domain-containing protein n=1 Tax=Knipowitschia caucasica TaxID=637954 RepID=A0AAV2MQB9_KNICA